MLVPLESGVVNIVGIGEVIVGKGEVNAAVTLDVLEQFFNDGCKGGGR